jgi:hypothetical protein
MIKVLYKPVSILISVLGGVLAGAIFKRIWKIAAGEDEGTPGDRCAVGLAGDPGGRGAARHHLRLGQGGRGPRRRRGHMKLIGVWPGEDGRPPEQQAS